MKQKALRELMNQPKLSDFEIELKIGRQLQQTLLPQQDINLEGYDIDACYISAKQVGGDYYEIVPISESNAGLVMGDVSGKEIQGAILMTIFRTLINVFATEHKSSKECLSRINKFLATRLKRGKYITAFYGVLDSKQHKLNYCSAGHGPAMVFREDRNEIEKINAPGIALGFDGGPIFDEKIQEQSLELNKGDRLVIYSNGVIDVRNINGASLSESWLESFSQENAKLSSREWIQRFMLELTKFQQGATLDDDITIITLKRL